MSDEEVRQAWLRDWAATSSELEASKRANDIPEVLVRRFRSLDAHDQAVVGALLADCLASADQRVRFDALAVISACGIRSAPPALRDLAARLMESLDPGAAFELTKVRRILEKLSATQDPPGTA